MASPPVTRRSIARNKRARHDYEVLERLEAGLVLTGTEVKSLRAGRATLAGSFVRFERDEPYLVGCQIPEYAQGNRMNHAPERPRKLLLHGREIRRLQQAVRQDGLTIIPLELYFLGARAKVEIAVGRGRPRQDKRQMLAKREARRDMDRAVRRRR